MTSTLMKPDAALPVQADPMIARRASVAEAVARKAGELALSHFKAREGLVIETKRHLTDLVSQADREVEILIGDALAQAFPDDGLLGEEHGWRRGSSGLDWIIDPIDGTAPYLSGLPGWCVSIGAWDGTRPVIGIIHAPVLGETYVAYSGGGASLNGVPISVTKTMDLRTGLLGVGANDRVPAQRVGEMLGALSAAGSSWIRYGSGALMLAFVAAGRLVGYAEPRMSSWDCMAGYCLIEEAGGKVLPFEGGPDLVAAAPVLGACPAAYGDILATTRLDDREWWEKTG